jgi:hypothetical protein
VSGQSIFSKILRPKRAHETCSTKKTQEAKLKLSKLQHYVPIANDHKPSFISDLSSRLVPIPMPGHAD